MTYRCALCGHKMKQPAVTIGSMAVGPTCSRKAGLIEIGRKRQGAVRLHLKTPVVREDDKTMDMFEGVEA